jgi:hypothetical protein
MSVTSHSSAVMRALTENARLGLAWSGELLVGWDVSSWYAPIGYLLMIGAAFQYFAVAERERAASDAHAELNVSLSPPSLEVKEVDADSDKRVALLSPSSGATASFSMRLSPVSANASSFVTASPSPSHAQAVSSSNDSTDTRRPCDACGQLLPSPRPAPVSALPPPALAPGSPSIAAQKPAAFSYRHSALVVVVVTLSLTYFMYLQVLCYQTGAATLSNAVGGCITLVLVLCAWSLRPHLIYAAAAPLSSAAAQPISSHSSLKSILHRSISGVVYWGCWSTFVPAFASLLRQMIFAEPEPLPAAVPSAEMIENILRVFSLVVLSWVLLPIRDFQQAYMKRDLLTRSGLFACWSAFSIDLCA